ncbi:uncharacterized protein LOC135163227 [Diachasmimorpha longicaudata]|uniref:uncharacterized protein LOC135163227 n=1 Tax=Diachasmimorpha longicaudata TaxID=58733 RepID=UPI0030B8B3D7
MNFIKSEVNVLKTIIMTHLVIQQKEGTTTVQNGINHPYVESSIFKKNAANAVRAALRVTNDPDPEDYTSETENLSIVVSDITTEQSEMSRRKTTPGNLFAVMSVQDRSTGKRQFVASRARFQFVRSTDKLSVMNV